MSIRLLVEAVSNEKHDMKLGSLQITVSVSRADDGKPYNGLTAQNFRITNMGGEIESSPNVAGWDYKLLVSERKWDPEDTEKSGVYDVVIQRDFGKLSVGSFFQSGENFSFGLQVREFRNDGLFAVGQTVVAVTSLEQVEL